MPAITLAQARKMRGLIFDRGSIHGAVGGLKERFGPSIGWARSVHPGDAWSAPFRGQPSTPATGYSLAHLTYQEGQDLVPPFISPVLKDAVMAVAEGAVTQLRSSISLGGNLEQVQFEMMPRNTWGNKRRTNAHAKPRTMGIAYRVQDGRWSAPGFRLNRDPFEYLAVGLLVEALAGRSNGSASNLSAELCAAYHHLLVDLKRTGSGTSPGRVSGHVKMHVLLVADLLYFWMRFRDQAHAVSHKNDRFEESCFGQAKVEAIVGRSFSGFWSAKKLATDQPSVEMRGILTNPEELETWLTTGVVVGAPSSAPVVEVSQSPVDTEFKGPNVIRAVMALSAGMNIRLLGPHGTGKSLCATEAVRLSQESSGSTVRDLLMVSGHESMQAADLIGMYVPGATKANFVWADGPLTTAMREGRPLFVDEGNRMPTKAYNVLMEAAGPTRTITLLENQSEQVKAKDGFLVMTAMNIGHAYVGTNVVDPALIDRFAVTLMFDYMEPEDEIKLLVDRTGVEKQLAGWMVAVAGEIRTQHANRQLTGDLTPRGLLAWAEMVQYVLAASPSKANQLVDVMTALPKWLWMPTVVGQDAQGRLTPAHSEAVQQIILNHQPKNLT